MANVFELVDKSGRKIRLTKRQCRETNLKHPGVASYLEEIKETLVKPDSITYYSIDDQVRYYYKYFKQLKELATDADLIYAQGPVGSGKPALKVKKQTNKKLVVKVVGDYAWEQARGAGKTELGIDAFQNQKFGG